MSFKNHTALPQPALRDRVQVDHLSSALAAPGPWLSARDSPVLSQREQSNPRSNSPIVQVHTFYSPMKPRTHSCCVSVHFAAVIGAQVHMFQHLKLMQERQNEGLGHGQEGFKQNKCVQHIIVCPSRCTFIQIIVIH